MSSSSASVLPDVNTNQSLRAATLSISTCMHRTKRVFVSGEIITGKDQRGAPSHSQLSESFSTSQTQDRHLITICPRSICIWQRTVTLNQSSDHMLASVTSLQCHNGQRDFKAFKHVEIHEGSGYNHGNFILLLQIFHRLQTLLSICSLSCCWISINSCPVTPHHNKLPVTLH